MIRRGRGPSFRVLLLNVAGCAILATFRAWGGEAAIADESASTHASEGRAQQQFREGLRLADANKLDEAARVFLRLTQEYPRLPEPYVQLAAVYQRQGNSQRAIGALRSALTLQTDPARLQEQLGDLYLELAAQAYRAAVESKNATDSARQKYSALEALTARVGR